MRVATLKKLEEVKETSLIKKALDKDVKAYWEGSPYYTGSNIRTIIDSGCGNNVLVFKDEFNCENITRLIKAIERIRQNGYTNLTLYFDSVGGVVSDMLTFIDYLNNLQEDMIVNIVSNGYLHSAGFYMFFLIDWMKPNLGYVIHDLCECSTHKSTCEADVRELGKGLLPDFTNETYFIKNSCVNEWLYNEIINKIELSEEQLKYFKDGHEVYMTGKEMDAKLDKFNENKRNELEKEEGLAILHELKAKGISLETEKEPLEKSIKMAE